MEAAHTSYSASQTDSACRPAFTFFFFFPLFLKTKRVLTKMCLCFKKVSEKCYFNKLVLGEVGGREEGRDRGREGAAEKVVTMLSIFNIGCKITNAYNKQNIYSVLKI